MRARARWQETLGMVLVFTGSTGMIGLGMYFSAPYVRTFFGAPTNDDIYLLCVRGVNTEKVQARDPLGRAMFSGIATGICGSLKETCDRDPGGQECQLIRKTAIEMMQW